MSKPAPAIAPAPWNPAPAEPYIVYAMKALQAGNASEGQQQAALQFLIEVVCATYDQPFRPGGPEGERATAFACGMQFVGQQIVRLLNYDVKKLKPIGEPTHE